MCCCLFKIIIIIIIITLSLLQKINIKVGSHWEILRISWYKILYQGAGVSTGKLKNKITRGFC